VLFRSIEEHVKEMTINEDISKKTVMDYYQAKPEIKKVSEFQIITKNINFTKKK